MNQPERNNAVTLRGKPVTLVGPQLQAGHKAPDFLLLKGDMSPLTLSDLKGRKVLLSLPSVDTPVCEQELRRFNQEATALPNVQVVSVSVDLPFALKRFCAAAGVDKVTAVSDFKEHGFGTAYGVFMKENHLLARAVFVVDEHNKLTYVEYVSEVANQPNFDKLLEHLKHHAPVKA
jgi:thioredoxin-dependent peroxiredoxin